MSRGGNIKAIKKILRGKDILNTSQFFLEELNLIMNVDADLQKRVKK